MKPAAFVYDPEQIAACGLFCGACAKYQKGKCPGCRRNEKASWCRIRHCCVGHQWISCADCTLQPLSTCTTFNNLTGRIFALLFGSDRPACIARIREIGYEAYAVERHATGQMTIRKKRKHHS